MNTLQTINEEITTVATELLNTHNIRSDRELFNKLKLTKEEKLMVMKWIQYQTLYAKRSGFNEGREQFKSDLRDLLGIKEDNSIHTLF